MISIQKENLKSKPKKCRLEKGFFLGHPNSGSCVQMLRLLNKIFFYFYQYPEKIRLFPLL